MSSPFDPQRGEALAVGPCPTAEGEIRSSRRASFMAVMLISTDRNALNLRLMRHYAEAISVISSAAPDGSGQHF
ncbi:hypothetical protein HFO63_25145 [Rhizobium laguerreae]|uniref:hypothetical protein n=1 Tax=Rhizobium laguerreae TaxID=1076926 RepID=UPI001C923E31|nr:hypothetical protein [Rhizobium laguerreae]MBY3087990.1 hypothetical protein [Rhizobium laguerreae]MBY3148829.1 hypothetical protein [Rhizobium laguerreae]